MLAITAWILALVVDLIGSAPPPLTDQLWFWSAVLILCPLIAVLGSRRPTSRVWTWFVIVPLLLVLGWPALTVLAELPQLRPLRVELPPLLGFLLVLVMGAGNYLTTRFGGSSLLLMLATTLILLPFATIAEGRLPSASMLRAIGALLMGFSVLSGAFQAARPTVAANRFDRLWFDFRDLFGIVWATRVQERINQMASEQRWSCRLTVEGFEWGGERSSEPGSKSDEQIEHALRWLLRRFVDPPWIDERLADPEQIPEAHHAEVT